MLDFFTTMFEKYEKRQRFSMVVNCLTVTIMGAVIGLACAWLVLTVNDLLPSPWSYLCAIAVPLIAKTAVMWLNTLVVSPFIKKLVPKIFKDLTGITVHPHQTPSTNITGNILTLPVAVTIAVTVYLSGLKPDDTTHINSSLIYYIAILVGAVVSLTENLCNPTVIRSLWHNRAEYQDSPLYQQPEKAVFQRQNSRPARTGNTPTSNQRRKAKRNRPKGKRRP